MEKSCAPTYRGRSLIPFGICLFLGTHAEFLKAQILNSVDLAQQAPTHQPPRFPRKIPASLAACVFDRSNSELNYFERSADYQRRCSETELLEKLDSFRRLESRNFNPALAVVIGKILLAEIKIKQNLLFQSVAPGAPVLSEGLLFSRAQNTWRETEQEFWKTTEPIVAEAQAWLNPIINEGRMRREQPFLAEAAKFLLLIYGESLRFESLLEHLKAHGSLLGENRKSTDVELLKILISWNEKFFPPPSAVSVAGLDAEAQPASQLKDWPLFGWLNEKLLQSRSGEITGSGGEDEFFVWSQSLVFQFHKEGVVTHRAGVLETLRRLWIAFPSDSYSRRIRTLADRLGLGAAFKAPTLRDLKLDEILVRAKSQVRALDSLSALRTMRRVRLLDIKEISDEDLWNALIYHVRVLRLLDERPQIPATIKSYLALRNFLNPPQGTKKGSPPNSSEIQKHLGRLHELSRLYWNYDDPQKALDVVNKILEVNKKFNTQFFVGQALVIRARIKEQSGELSGAIQLADQALGARLPQDLTEDLLWRKIYLKLDEVRSTDRSPAQDTQHLSSLLNFLEPLRKISERDPIEKARWNYWMGRVHQLVGDKNKSAQFFEKTYEIDPLSFYGNLAGLRLLNEFSKTPTGWRIFEKGLDTVGPPGTRKWETPNWDLFLTPNGRASDPLYRSFARVYGLASLGLFDSAKEAFSDLDRSTWQIVLSSRIPWNKRREYARAVSWMRKALGDAVGALRSAEIARQAKVEGLDEEDFLNLYPLPFWDLIQGHSAKNDLNPWLTASLIRQESAFDQMAKSWANAIGLMQIIPPVAEQEAKMLGWKDFNPENLYEPQKAIELGTFHLGRLVKNFQGSWICSVAAYNAGSPPVIKWLGAYSVTDPDTFIERIPFLETRNYVKSILRNFINYQRIYSPQSDLSLGALLKMPPRPIRGVSSVTEGPSGANSGF